MIQLMGLVTIKEPLKVNDTAALFVDSRGKFFLQQATSDDVAEMAGAETNVVQFEEKQNAAI